MPKTMKTLLLIMPLVCIAAMATSVFALPKTKFQRETNSKNYQHVLGKLL